MNRPELITQALSQGEEPQFAKLFDEEEFEITMILKKDTDLTDLTKRLVEQEDQLKKQKTELIKQKAIPKQMKAITKQKILLKKQKKLELELDELLKKQQV